MATITRVKRSRKEYTCGRCGKKIEVGQPYLRGDLNFSRPVIRCCKCGLEHWEVTTSEYQLSVGEIVNRWYQHNNPDEDGRDSIVCDLESIRDDLQDRLDNMPEGLQQGDTGCLLQDRIDSLDSAISELEDIDFDDEERDEDDLREAIDEALGYIEM